MDLLRGAGVPFVLVNAGATYRDCDAIGIDRADGARQSIRHLLASGYPIHTAAGPTFGLPELGPTLFYIGAFLVLYARFAKTYPMVSPRLAMITLTKEHAHH